MIKQLWFYTASTEQIISNQAQSGAAIGMSEVDIASDRESDDPGALFIDSDKETDNFEVVRDKKIFYENDNEREKLLKLVLRRSGCQRFHVQKC